MPRMVQIYTQYPKVGTDDKRWRHSDPMIEDDCDIFIPVHRLWSTCVYAAERAVWSEEHSCSVERDLEGMPYLSLSHWDKQDAAQATDLMKQKFWNNVRAINEEWSYDHPLHRAAKYYWFKGVKHKTSNTCLPQLYVQGTHHCTSCDSSIVLGLLWSVLYDRLPPLPTSLHEQLRDLVESKIEGLKNDPVDTVKSILWGGDVNRESIKNCAQLAKKTWAKYKLIPDWGVNREYLKSLGREYFIAMVPHTVSEIIVPSSFTVRETMAYPDVEENEVVITLASQSVTRNVQMKTRVYQKPFSGTKLNIEFSESVN